MTSELPFHLKYRPTSLDKLIGHEAVVGQLKGIIKSGKIPNALLIVGPSSAGKTTLARAFSCALNGVDNVKELQGAYQEINAADQRTIEDMRDLIRKSRFKSGFKRRVIVIDESQQLLSSAAAAAALLKPVEEPASGTLWIFCTMDPQKFGAGTGRAIANRCQQLVLEAPGEAELTKYGKRILKREGMKYALPVLDELVSRSNSEFRTLAQMLQACQQWAETNGGKNLQKNLPSILSTFQAADDDLAIEVMTSIYSVKYQPAVLALLDVQDHFRFVNSLLWCSQHMLNVAVLGGKRHPQVKHWARVNREVESRTRKLKLTLGQLAMVNEAMVNLKAESLNFQVDAVSLLSARIYRLVKSLKDNG